jgi:hypothetical protein
MAPLDFDEWVLVLRRRIGAAEALSSGEVPTFKTLMSDYAEVTPEAWYHHAFDELEALGHIDSRASGKVGGGDAFATLSAEGRHYLRHDDDDAE